MEILNKVVILLSLSTCGLSAHQVLHSRFFIPFKYKSISRCFTYVYLDFRYVATRIYYVMMFIQVQFSICTEHSLVRVDIQSLTPSIRKGLDKLKFIANLDQV